MLSNIKRGNPDGFDLRLTFLVSDQKRSLVFAQRVAAFLMNDDNHPIPVATTGEVGELVLTTPKGSPLHPKHQAFPANPDQQGADSKIFPVHGSRCIAPNF